VDGAQLDGEVVRISRREAAFEDVERERAADAAGVRDQRVAAGDPGRHDCG